MAATFADAPADPEKASFLAGLDAVAVDNISGRGAKELRERLISLADRLEPESGPLEGLVDEGDLVILVTPMDLGRAQGAAHPAPGREHPRPPGQGLRGASRSRSGSSGSGTAACRRPRLVVTDSQAFSKVAADIPEDQSLTSFSILFARKKGDIGVYLDGAAALESMKSGGARPHARGLLPPSPGRRPRHGEDTPPLPPARPGRLEFEYARELPGREELSRFSLVVTCGSCMRTRREVLVRLDRIKEAGVAVVNYGIFLAWANGLLPRAVEMLPEYSSPRAGRGRRRALSETIRARRSAAADGPRPLVVLGLLALWQAASGLGWTNAYLLPSPLRIARALVLAAGNGELLRHAAASGARVALGFALAVALAFPAAVLVSFAPAARLGPRSPPDLPAQHPAPGPRARPHPLVRHRRGLEAGPHRPLGLLPDLHGNGHRPRERRSAPHRDGQERRLLAPAASSRAS